MSEKSFRKPYKAPVDKLWYTKNPFYFLYILREGTAFACFFVALEILFGVFTFCLSDFSAAFPTDRSASSYLWFVQSFLGNPLVLLINVACLAASLFHAITWFALMPKAVRVFMNKTTTELLPEKMIITALYGALAGVSLVILAAAFISMP